MALCGLGLAMRVSGLTSRDPWFDDAWAALPAHVPLGDALRMVVTTPLYALGLREWIRLGPADTWWAQLPALVLGVLGIAATYLLVRAHRFSPLAGFVAAAVIAAGPITVNYSTRLKEYSADLLLSCLVLWLVNRWRRNPSWGKVWALAAVSVVALWISASTAAIIGGAAAVAVMVAWSNHAARRQVAALVGTLAAGSLALWLAFLRQVPAQLRTNWRTHGYLFGYSSGRHVTFEFQQTFAGLAHGLLGIPIPYTFKGYALRGDPMGLAVATALVLVLLVVPPLFAVAQVRARYVGPLTASAMAVVIAVIGTLSGAAPLGDGRTDEALYPAILLLLVGGVTELSARGRLPTIGTPVTRVGIALVFTGGSLWYGITHTAQYPPTGLRAVVAELRHELRPGDLVVVDPYWSFAWADDGLGPWHVSFHQGVVPWPMGFHVVSTDPRVLLSTNYLQPDTQLYRALARDVETHRSARVWYLGLTVGAFSTSAPEPLWPLAFQSPTYLYMNEPRVTACHHTVGGLSCALGNGLGLRPRDVCCSVSGAYAQLYELNPPARRDPHP